MPDRPKLPTRYAATVHLPGGRKERRFVVPGKHRTETVSDNGRPIITIRREDKGVVWVIHPADKIYYEQKTAQMDKMMALLFPPVKLDWNEAGPVVIDGVDCQHLHGVGTTRHGPTEEDIYVDADGMFRRESCLLKGMEQRIEYSEVSLDEISEGLFEFDKKGFKKQRV